MNNKPIQKHFYLILVIFSLVGQIAWVIENMYLNVFIYKMFSASAAAISAMVTASAVAATVTTLFIGALSDKLGKRKLFIAGGYILWGISIIGFAFIRLDLISALFPAVVSAASVGVSLTIVMDCLMTFFGSSANDACFNAWLTESVPDEKRGSAEGINAMMPLLAIIVVFGGFMGFDLNQAQSWTTIFLIIGVVVLLIGIAGLFMIKESTVKAQTNHSFWNNLIYSFKPSVIKQNKMLYITLAAFGVFGISIQVFMPYLILYYNVSLGMENYILIMAPAILLASVVTALYGKVFDQKGFTQAIVPAILSLMIGYVLLYLFTGTALVFAGSLFMMIGYLCGCAVFGAMIRRYIPQNKAGMFQGVRIIGQVLIPGIVGPIIGARVLKNAQTLVNDDGTTSFIPNKNIFLAALVVGVVLAGMLAVQCYLLKKEKGEAQ